MYFSNYFVVVGPPCHPSHLPCLYFLSTSGSRCSTLLLTMGREAPPDGLLSRPLLLVNPDPSDSLPQHLLPPCSSLHRSSPALDSSTMVCSPPNHHAWCPQHPKLNTTALLNQSMELHGWRATTVPPGWLDRVVHNHIHGRRGLIWKRPVTSSMAGPLMDGAQCEGDVASCCRRTAAPAPPLRAEEW
jgi:hypothetical protein